MMKIKIVMLLTIGMLLPTVSYAQKIGNPSGETIEIDCRGMKGSSTESKGFKNTSTDTKATENPVGEYTSVEANQHIYARFAVTTTDVGNGANRWTEALKACTDKGAGWRLPTHRELVLILILGPELQQKGCEPLEISQNFGYWSATVAGTGWLGWNDEEVWTVGWVIGISAKDRTIGEKVNRPNKIRCIKEL